MNKFLALCACFALLSGKALAFEIQTMPNKTITDQLNSLTSERLAQDKLPVAKGGFWDKLWQCKIAFNNKNGDYSVKLTDEVKAMDGKTVQIPGFMYPLSMEEKQKEILLSKRTPVCFFCPPGEPNEVLDVKMAKPAALNSDLVNLEGTFKLVDKKQEGIFFMLENAKVVTTK